MKSKNEILCEDCMINYINQDRLIKYGKCLSCQRRETIAKTHNVEYVPYKNLPQEEKDRLARQRNTNNKWRKKVTAIKKADGNEEKLKEILSAPDELPPEFLIRKFLEKYGYLNLSFVCVKGYDIYNKFKKYCNDENYVVLTLSQFDFILRKSFGFEMATTSTDKYYYKGGTEEDFRLYLANATKKDTSKNTLRPNQIYTPEIIDEILATANSDMSVPELRQIFIDKYPDLNITVSNFNNIVARHKVPHSNKRGKSKNVIEETIIINPVKTHQLKSKETEEVVETINNKSDFISEIVDTIQTDTKINKPKAKVEIDEDGDPIRLKPIKAEVVSILDEKFKKENCYNQYNYTVEDYINMFEMFEYLASNIDGLIRCRDRQFNIVNDYQFDILHEMENELAEDGDTYLQDKVYVLRDYRRYMDMDYRALKAIRPILKLIKTVIHPNNPNNTSDPKSISGSISSLKGISDGVTTLKKLVNANAQPKFTPRVDTNMTNKYDWAKMRNSNYKKAVENGDLPVLTTKIDTTNKETEVTSKANILDKQDLGKELDEIDNQIKEDKPISKSIALQDRGIKVNASLKNIKSNISLTEDQIKLGFGVYRVSCRISGGGFGVFRPWYKDYTCVNKEIAMSFAQQEFARMKSENGSILFTEIECHKLNVV